MPVAIVRATKKDLPFTFQLDDWASRCRRETFGAGTTMTGDHLGSRLLFEVHCAWPCPWTVTDAVKRYVTVSIVLRRKVFSTASGWPIIELERKGKSFFVPARSPQARWPLTRVQTQTTCPSGSLCRPARRHSPVPLIHVTVRLPGWLSRRRRFRIRGTVS